MCVHSLLAVLLAASYGPELEGLEYAFGLEDWKALGLPWRSVDDAYARELKTTVETYAGLWRPEYDRWTEMLAGMYRGPCKEAVAWNSALPKLGDYPKIQDPAQFHKALLEGLR